MKSDSFLATIGQIVFPFFEMHGIDAQPFIRDLKPVGDPNKFCL
jgi:hypothetical protein